jgi:hypothetical protein
LRGHFDGKAIRYNDPLWNPGFCTLSEWQTFSNTDLHSHYTDLVSTADYDIKFEYNASYSPKTISLSKPMVDAKGIKYAASATIAPFGSIVLMTDPAPAVLDAVKPVISNFTIPTAATSLSVSGITLVATDNIGVTGYLLSETNTTPALDANSWSSSTPTTYTFGGQGTKTLYAWVRDAVGNVSTSSLASITINISSSGGGGGGGSSSSGGGGSLSSSATSTITTTTSSTVSTVVATSTASTTSSISTSNDSTNSGTSTSARALAIEAAASQLVAAEKQLVTKINKKLATNLAGRLLLQVESHGEAWYLNPANNLKYYLGTPAMALAVMRSLGQGISNSNLAKIKVADANINTSLDTDGDGLSDSFEDAIGSDKNKSDTDGDGYGDKQEFLNGYNVNGANKLAFDNNFVSQQAGRILLQVESHGEAWYINPFTKLRYYLGRPEDAYSLMRSLSLGVSNSNLRQIGVGETK